MKYYTARTGNIRGWFRRVDLQGLRLRLLDASGHTPQALAGYISYHLQGKDKPTYRPNRDDGDIMVVVNATKMEYSEHYLKFRYWKGHTRYRDGAWFKRAAGILMKQGGQELLRREVKTRLPVNALRKIRLRKLLIYDNNQYDFNPQYLWPLEGPPQKPRGGKPWEIPEGFTPMNPPTFWRKWRGIDQDWKEKQEADQQVVGRRLPPSNVSWKRAQIDREGELIK
eukprot:TRINITY_DN3955_c0_g1_i1.p2 TRINITY_DN3955_c0_g1~~TRINITY_DN3955_c0_g1_i1.p2  ORF type:complete len:247 (-),score=20.60 TRINITY_DN3955_c0_g1_i1:1100-1774(-)